MKIRIRRISRHPELLLGLGCVGLVLLLIVPLPPLILDTLISLSIVFSVITLLLTIYIENALEFSAFPSLLLCLTLFRLGLNIASTRMILLEASAGDIISAFGGFVTQGNSFVGLILFLLLTMINFIVVTKGAGRIAEVSARFTLESLPGKQLGIDADLNAKFLTFEEAKLKRRKIAEEADFYGAMDGASKFVKGDAIATLIITFVNVFGGLAIGLFVKGLSLTECIETYTLLTVGDGLVSQIPALLISLAAGMMLTRASYGSLGQIIPKQIFYNSKVLLISGIIIFILGFLPGMPRKIFIPLSLLLFGGGYFKSKENKEKQIIQKEDGEECDLKEEMEKALVIHPIELELSLLCFDRREEILFEIKKLRSLLAKKLGILIPPFHLTQMQEIKGLSSVLKIKGMVLARGKFESEKELKTWIESLAIQLEHHAHILLNRQEVYRLIENAKAYDLAVVEELIPKKITIGILLKVLQNLLKESLPINDIGSILEILADHIPDQPKPESLHPDHLSELLRINLLHRISKEIIGQSDIIHVITLDPKVEQMIAVSVTKGERGERLLLRPLTSIKITSALLRLTKVAKERGVLPVVITQPASRLHLRRLIEKQLPHLPILSYNELSEEKTLKTIGKVTTDVLI